MDDKTDISSILNAVDEINLKPKKKIFKAKTAKITVPKFNKDFVISPDIDKLIREAEEYKKASKVPLDIISSQRQQITPQKEEALILSEEFHDNYKNVNQINIELKKKIKNLESAERILHIQIKNLQKNRLLISRNSVPPIASFVTDDFISTTKENLRNIYSQVEQQKKIYLNLKNHSEKVERDSNVYKENYERLIVENYELQTRLKITKEQIINYENNKKDLMLAIHNLNEIISKSNVVGNISPQKSVESKDPKKVTKIDSVE